MIEASVAVIEKNEAATTENSFVTANDVIKYFLLKSQPGTPYALTPLKIQKLLYYAQGSYLALNDQGQPLFNEDFLATKNGPLVYYEGKDEKLQFLNALENSSGNPNDILYTFSDEQNSILEAVWEVYGKFDETYLEQLTLQEDPILLTERGNVIDKEKIRDYFKEILRVS